MKHVSTAMHHRRRVSAGVGLSVLLALVLQVPVTAMEAPAQGLREPPRAAAGLSQDRVIAIAERRYRAQVVRVEESSLRGKRVFVLRLLSKEGRVWTVRVDAETGGEV